MLNSQQKRRLVRDRPDNVQKGRSIGFTQIRNFNLSCGLLGNSFDTPAPAALQSSLSLRRSAAPSRRIIAFPLIACINLIVTSLARIMTLKQLHRVPAEEGARHLTDTELRKKLNEVIDQVNAQLEEIIHLRGQLNLLTLEVRANRRR